MRKSTIIVIIIDLLAALLGFGLWQYLANQISLGYFWLAAAGFWVVVSVLLGKLDYTRYRKFRYLLIATIIANALIFAVLCLALFLIEPKFQFWSIYLTIPIGITLLECGIYSLHQQFIVKRVNYLEEELIQHYAEIQTINKESDISADIDSTLQKFVSAMSQDFPTDVAKWKEAHEADFGAGTVILTTPEPGELDEAKAKGARI